MKGFNIDLIQGVLVSIVALVVLLTVYATVLGGQKERSFMNLPEGVWLSVDSANTKTFVLPPVVWFGKKLKNPDLGGSINFGRVFKEGNPDEFIFPSNSVYIKNIVGLPAIGNFNYIKLLESALFYPLSFPLQLIFPDGNFGPEIIFKLNVAKTPFPLAGFYPLLTDDFGSLKSGAPAECNFKSGSDLCYLNTKKPFGKVKVSLTIDFNKLHIEGYDFKREEEFINNNINLGVDYFTDSDPRKGNCFGEVGSERKAKTVKELVDSGYCIKDETSLKYNCSFNLMVAEKCCPSYVNIKPIIEINIADEDEPPLYKTLDINPLPFMVVYYLDFLGDRDFVFEKFVKGPGGIQENLFYDDADSKHGPVRNILVYPCRAKAKSISSLLHVRGIESEIIEWDKCESSTADYINLSSGWFCKRVSANNYYLYNYNAFCKLDGYDLPNIPEPVYLEGIIPSKNVAKRLNLPWFLPDIKYGEYKESAWFWAKYMVSRSRDILSFGIINRDIIFPEDINIGGVIIKFDFGDWTTETVPDEDTETPASEEGVFGSVGEVIIDG
ncbi:MAG: hypothetical protein KAU95_00930 [Candidatus Aenigmarchaeota archaeon]|nr:hypothetical protein [Candidatus Aenigmarchaeota archaeon]